MWFLPSEIHGILLIIFLILGFITCPIDAAFFHLEGWALYFPIIVAFILNVTSSKGEKFSDQRWIL